MAEIIEIAATAVEIVNAIKNFKDDADKLRQDITNAYQALSESYSRYTGTYVAMYRPRGNYIRAASQPWLTVQTFRRYLLRLAIVDFSDRNQRKQVSGILATMATLNQLPIDERLNEELSYIAPYHGKYLSKMADLNYALTMPTGTSGVEYLNYSTQYHSTVETLLDMSHTEYYTRDTFEDSFKIKFS